MIEAIHVENFKALKSINLADLPPLAVFVGKNGVGKTSLFRVFSLLKSCLSHNVRVALQQEGGFNGFKDVITRGVGESESIVIQLKFYLIIASKRRLVTYRLEIGLEGRKPVVRREILRYKRAAPVPPFILLIFPKAKELRSAMKKTSANLIQNSPEKSRRLIQACWPSAALDNSNASRPQQRFAS